MNETRLMATREFSTSELGSRIFSLALSLCKGSTLPRELDLSTSYDNGEVHHAMELDQRYLPALLSLRIRLSPSPMDISPRYLCDLFPVMTWTSARCDLVDGCAVDRDERNVVYGFSAWWGLQLHGRCPMCMGGKGQ